MTSTPDRVPRLVDALARHARRRPIARKLLVAPNHAAGRELLRRLSLAGTGWIGFEITTTQRLAQRLAQARLEAEHLRVVDAFDQQALLDRALDSALAAERGVLGELSEGIGFRERVHAAVRELRLAGIGPRELDASRFAQWEKKLFLLRVLQRYERLLTERHRADPATILRLALAALEDAGGQLPPSLDVELVLLMPGLNTRGLTGRLIAALAARGAKVLETDPVAGLDAPGAVLWGRCGEPSGASYLFDPVAEARGDAPPIELFSAASVDAELREVLRRVIESGLSWDEVEIVTPDPETYGSALHALSVRLGIPVTYAVGLPIARTRTGRVIQTYLDWIEEGFQANPIRRLLEAGDLRPPRSRGRHSAAALARRFRTLRVGWGRKRYRAQIRAALVGVDRMEAGRREPPEVFERRRDRARGELEALRAILFPALKATPAVPDRMGEGGSAVSPAELARGLKAFLKRVPRGTGPDRSAREEVARILERVEATLNRRTHFRGAVSILRRHLDIRVRPELVGDDPDGSGAPWSSAGGALHLSDLEHGGYAGRPRVFIVGLDGERMPGGRGQDPVLLDGDRRVLGPDLPTSAELLRERVFDFAALFSRLRGTITLSYGAWQATEARTVGPSSILLQALRLREGNAELTFEHLHAALGRVTSAVPTSARALLDSDDVWMAALGSGTVMKRGVQAVRSAFPEIDRGLVAARERRTGVPGPVHGVVTARPDDFDPRLSDSLVLSASRLEALGTCPLRYLHGTVLRIYPPDDPELNPEAWLDHRQRGSLLHEVYDVALRDAQNRGVKPADAEFEALALRALAERIAVLRETVPIPGEGTLARESAGLREDVRSFVRMIRQTQPMFDELEFKFGIDDDPVRLSIPGGEVRLRGAIDRVDSDLGGLHVIDYKTGGTHAYGKEAFNGGRRLQHAVYAYAAEALLNRDVVDGQYHFPTRKGQNQVFAYPRERLDRLPELLGLMFDAAAAGHFVPTDTADDCTFCDFAAVCRASRGDFGKIDSPLADWSQELGNTGMWPAFHQLRKIRAFSE